LERGFRRGIVPLGDVDYAEQSLIKRIVGIELVQGSCNYRCFFDPPGAQFGKHEGRARDRFASFCGEDLLKLRQPFLILACVDFGDRNASLDRGIFGIERSSLFKLLQRQFWLAISHIRISENAQRGRVGRRFARQRLQILDRA
jgi:hypothetical protein